VISTETLAFTYGLSSAVTWGAGDFTGGFATKRNNVHSVILVSQFVGGIFLVLLALCFREKISDFSGFLFGGLAGFSGVLGLVALYTGLARGRMGIVAPLSAIITAVLPVITGIVTEGLPTAPQLLGFGMALISIWFLSYSFSGTGVRSGEVYFPVLAGLGFGLFFIFIDRAIAESVLWPLVGARIASVGLMGLLLLIRNKSWIPAKGQIRFMVMAGIFDASGNAFFALATRLGRLDISAVLSSFYPGATILLAWVILKERLQWSQWFGVVIALLSLGLIAL
jgi:uncharacterized membrane protein